jgi:hypothetical protein
LLILFQGFCKKKQQKTHVNVIQDVKSKRFLVPQNAQHNLQMDVRLDLRTRTSAHLRVVETKIDQIPWRWWANVAAQVGCKHRAIAAREINCIFYLKTQA